MKWLAVLAVSAAVLSSAAAHAGEYVNDQYGFAFEMPRSCEEMPAPIFENMLRTISTDKLPSLNQQYVTAIQCDNMPWFEYPYFVVEYRPGDFSRFVSEPAPAALKQKAPAPAAGMPRITVDHDRKIIFSAMDANPGGFAVKDMGAGFFRKDAMVFLHFYVPNRLAKHFTPIFDHAVTSFRFTDRPGVEMVETKPAAKPATPPAAKPKAVKVTPPAAAKTEPKPAAQKKPVPEQLPAKPPELPPEQPAGTPQPTPAEGVGEEMPVKTLPGGGGNLTPDPQSVPAQPGQKPEQPIQE